MAAIRQGGRDEQAAMYYLFHQSGWKDEVRMMLLRLEQSPAKLDEVFNDSLLILLKHLRNPGSTYQMRGALKQYFKGIAYNVWAKLRKKENQRNHNDQKYLDTQISNLNEEGMTYQQLYNEDAQMLLNRLLDQIGKVCRKVIQLKGRDYSHQEIASIVPEIKDAAASNLKHSRCRAKLRALIDQHPKLVITILKHLGWE